MKIDETMSLFFGILLLVLSAGVFSLALKYNQTISTNLTILMALYSGLAWYVGSKNMEIYKELRNSRRMIQHGN